MMSHQKSDGWKIMSYLTQLKTFVEVYRSGNITRAATRLHMSQPAVTSHIQAMEHIVGKELFVRKARGVEPTAIADDLALQVASHIDILEQKVASIRSRASTDHGTLHLAGPAEYLSFVAGPALANLLPADKVNLVIHTVLVMNRVQGKLLADKEITASLLNQHKVVSYDEQLPLIRRYFSEVFNAPCESPVAAICPDIRAISSIIKAGIGYSVLPDYLCKEAIAKGELVSLGKSGPENEIYLVWKKGALRHPRVDFAKDVIMAFANINYLASYPTNNFNLAVDFALVNEANCVRVSRN